MALSHNGTSALPSPQADRRPTPSSCVFRGGNSRHTRNVRCDSDAYSTGVYSYDEVWKDLCGVGDGPSDERLAELTVRESESVPAWMSAHGVRRQRPLSGTLHLGRTNRFFLGGGKALVNTYYRAAARAGITVRYDCAAEELVFDGDVCTELVVRHEGVRERIRATAVVCASGGFEANIGRSTEAPAVLDGRSTAGLAPPKSNWAQRIDTPPFSGIAMRPGITFTYMGGFGMTIGTVWGRIAGHEAARHAAR